MNLNVYQHRWLTPCGCLKGVWQINYLTLSHTLLTSHDTRPLSNTTKHQRLHLLDPLLPWIMWTVGSPPLWKVDFHVKLSLTFGFPPEEFRGQSTQDNKMPSRPKNTSHYTLQLLIMHQKLHESQTWNWVDFSNMPRMASSTTLPHKDVQTK